MMIQANGENRKWFIRAAVGALITATCTELGKWAVEALKKRVKS